MRETRRKHSKTGEWTGLISTSTIKDVGFLEKTYKNEELTKDTLCWELIFPSPPWNIVYMRIWLIQWADGLNIDTRKWVRVYFLTFLSAQKSPWAVWEGVTGRSLETCSLTQSNSIHHWLTITFPSYEQDTQRIAMWHTQ